MRALLSLLLVGACASGPQRSVATYDLDTHTMVPIVYAATHAHHYRVAVVDPKEGHARFVMVPTGGGAPVVVHVAGQSYHVDRFSTCLGTCSTAIEVTAAPGDDAHARELLDAIDTRAQAARLDQ